MRPIHSNKFLDFIKLDDVFRYFHNQFDYINDHLMLVRFMFQTVEATSNTSIHDWNSKPFNARFILLIWNTAILSEALSLVVSHYEESQSANNKLKSVACYMVILFLSTLTKLINSQKKPYRKYLVSAFTHTDTHTHQLV